MFNSGFMKQVNYHTHTKFSDGKEAPEAYVKEALDQNLLALGFSDHAPINLDCNWTMKPKNAKLYVDTIHQLKVAYQDQIQIYCGLEVDFIPDLISVKDLTIRSLELDYTIGAVHFVDAFLDGTPWAVDSGPSVWKVGIKQIFNGSVEQAVTRYFELTREMVNTAPPTIVAHLDRIKKNNINEAYYSEQSAWYVHQIELTLEAIAASNSILEINTKGLYRSKFTEPYPSRWVLTKAKELNIPVHLAADAHHPYLITGSFEQASQILSDVGYTESLILIDNEWKSVSI